MLMFITSLILIAVLIWWFTWRWKTYSPKHRALSYAQLEEKANAGDEDAQYELAMAYYTERNPAHYPMIFKWVLYLAKKGEDPGMMLLVGDLYLTGTGVTANAGTALKWYERALSADIMLGSRTPLSKDAHDYLEAQVIKLRKDLNL